MRPLRARPRGRHRPSPDPRTRRTIRPGGLLVCQHEAARDRGHSADLRPSRVGRRAPPPPRCAKRTMGPGARALNTNLLGAPGFASPRGGFDSGRPPGEVPIQSPSAAKFLIRANRTVRMAVNPPPTPQTGLSFCSRCGTPLNAGATFCSKCGTPAGGVPLGAPSIAAPMVATPPPSRKRRRWVLPVIIVVVVIVVVGIAAAVLVGLSQATGVKVTAVNWSGSNSCGGLSGSSTVGFTGSDGATFTYTVTGLTNLDPILSCTITSIASGTSGFSISGGNLPLTIAASGTASLSITVNLPSSSYSGVLDLVVS